MDKYRVLVCGDRDWWDALPIYQAFHALFQEHGTNVVIIHGAARGADTQAGGIARWFGFEVVEYPAEWKRWGKAAGAIRNRYMLTHGKPNVVAAFHDDIENSKGTKDMLAVAKKAGVPTYLFKSTYGQDGQSG